MHGRGSNSIIVRVTCAEVRLRGRPAGRRGLRDGLEPGRCGPEAWLLLLLLWTCMKCKKQLVPEQNLSKASVTRFVAIA